MQALVQSMRLQVDYQKSWHWGTTKAFHDSCVEFQTRQDNPGESVQILSCVKDLGELYITIRVHPLVLFVTKLMRAFVEFNALSGYPAICNEKHYLFRHLYGPMRCTAVIPHTLDRSILRRFVVLLSTLWWVIGMLRRPCWLVIFCPGFW